MALLSHLNKVKVEEPGMDLIIVQGSLHNTSGMEMHSLCRLSIDRLQNDFFVLSSPTLAKSRWRNQG